MFVRLSDWSVVSRTSPRISASALASSNNALFSSTRLVPTTDVTCPGRSTQVLSVIHPIVCATKARD